MVWVAVHERPELLRVMFCRTAKILPSNLTVAFWTQEMTKNVKTELSTITHSPMRTKDGDMRTYVLTFPNVTSAAWIHVGVEFGSVWFSHPNRDPNKCSLAVVVFVAAGEALTSSLIREPTFTQTPSQSRVHQNLFAQRRFYTLKFFKSVD